MPPTPKNTRSPRLAVVDHTGWVVGEATGLDAIASFFNMDVVGAALKQSGFDGLARTTKLIELCQSVDEKVALAALRELRATMREVLELNGVIAQLDESHTTLNERGTLVKQAARTRSIMSSLTEKNRRALSTSPAFQVGRVHEPETHTTPTPLPTAPPIIATFNGTPTHSPEHSGAEHQAGTTDGHQEP